VCYTYGAPRAGGNDEDPKNIVARLLQNILETRKLAVAFN
jgi:hypothetical protein